MTSEQLLEKVKKLLALAASPNENEAKLAARRAKEIISRYCLDLKGENKVEDIQEIPFVFPAAPPSLLQYLPFIALNVAKPYGVHILLRNRNRDIYLVGFSTNCKVADHAITCILNWGLQDYRAAYRKYRTISFGDGFWNAFDKAVRERFQESKEEAENALILYDSVKDYMSKFGSANIKTFKGNYGQTEGYESGQSAQVNPGVGQNSGFGGLLR